MGGREGGKKKESDMRRANTVVQLGERGGRNREKEGGNETECHMRRARRLGRDRRRRK